MLTPTQYRSEPSIPEGLLIDLRNSVLVENDIPISPPISPPATTAGLAGDDLLLSWDTEPEGPHVRPNDAVESARVRSPAAVSSLETPTPLRSSTQSAPPVSSPPLPHDLTDLDILLSRVNDESAASGSDYDTLLMISQFLGPASPTSVEQSRQGTPRIPEPPAQPRSAPPMTHLVKEQRRRVTKDGRVKLKLMLEGISVDKCGICFTQFKKGDEASMGSPACQHPFHGKCLGNWYRNSRTCPHCRQPSS
ncbi:hypothetical protein BDV98DRAFT_502014 [Pterulicium gracile]|uniref:RING-type domain-containing protein n=1 Tax=Pterulicium gracile TaxID=1884261 RepID=A0A5C3QR82_9AGAR|nr:hypothetical protein BDV98DRAFT_502014 [Pterula gracilis]